MYKKALLCILSLFLIFSSGCTSLSSSYPVTQLLNQELIEVENPDYTYSYKTSNGDIVFANIQQLIFKNGFATIVENEKYGIVDKYGNKIIEPMYDYISDYSEGLCAFFIRDINGVKIGYLNTKGEVVIEARPANLSLFSCDTYDYNFHNGLALYKSPQNEKFGYINKTGTLVIDTMYIWAEPFIGLLAPVTKGDRYGFIDTARNLKVPYKYVFAQAFSDGLAAVYNGKTWGYINESGSNAIPSKFGSFEGRDGEYVANPFIKGTAGVYLGEGQAYLGEEYKNQFALIDENGKILNNQKYDSLNLVYYDENKAEYRVKKEGKSFLIDNYGKILKEEHGE